MSDVARTAGVSRSTVSYALSGVRPISEDVKNRIFAAMKQLDYSPNALARGLASRRSGIIAMLYPFAEHGVNLAGFDHIWAASDTARKAGYSMLLWTIDSDDIEQLEHLIQQGLVEGVIVMEIRENDPRIRFLLDNEFPFSEIGRSGIDGPEPFADTDFDQTAREALAYLHGLGHRRIGFLNHPQSAIDEGYGVAVKTRDAVLANASELGMEVHSVACETRFGSGREAFLDLISAHPDVTALVSVNERALLGAMDAAARSGLRCPEDLSIVVVLSSAETAEAAYPTLTTVSPEPFELGRQAMTALLDRVRFGTTAEAQVLVPSHLVVRESSGPARRTPAPAADATA